jgi:hypothetical protein
MEQDLAEKNTKITELEKGENELLNQITQKETEINQLKKQLEGSKRNEDEKKVWNFIFNKNYFFLTSMNTFDFTNDEAMEIKNYLLTGIAPLGKSGYPENFNPNNLGKDFVEIVNLSRVRNEFWRQLCQQNRNYQKVIKEKNDLQTKYDMEVRSKEELVEELKKERGWWDKWINDKGNFRFEKGDVGYYLLFYSKFDYRIVLNRQQIVFDGEEFKKIFKQSVYKVYRDQ